MAKKNASLLIVVYVIANALSIALMAIGIRDNEWVLAVIGLIMLACITILMRELKKKSDK